jgi:hypothetical protein
MTHKDEELLKLAERCEKATGSDNWLSADIGVLLGIPGDKCPHFTASLDAAMTLVPEGWVRKIETWPDNPLNGEPHRAHVELLQCSTKRWGRDDVWGHGSEDGKVRADGHTDALALCAAALRTRTTGDDKP